MTMEASKITTKWEECQRHHRPRRKLLQPNKQFEKSGDLSFFTWHKNSLIAMIKDWETSIKLRLGLVWQRVRSIYNNFDQSIWQLEETFKLQLALVWQRARNTCGNLDKSTQQSWQIRVPTWRNLRNILEKLWRQLGFNNAIGRLWSDLGPTEIGTFKIQL